MGFIEDIRVGEERAETGLGAEIDRPAAIFEARKIGGIGVAKYPPAEGDKARKFLLLKGQMAYLYCFGLHFRDENFKRIDRQSMGGLTVFKRSALENRICSSCPLISLVREKSRSSFFSEKFRMTRTVCSSDLRRKAR